MTSRFDGTGWGYVLLVLIVALTLTVWQVHVDRSVFERFFGSRDPTVVVLVTSILGLVFLGYLQATSHFFVFGPGRAGAAARFIAVAAPVFASTAIAADVVLRYPEDTNVPMPDALRFYPAIAVVVEVALHVVPVAVLGTLLGMPAQVDATFWRLAVPVALIEAALQAGYAPSTATAIFSAVHLLVFGVVQIWMFWRFGFLWMLSFRLAYYGLWHVAWGTARLKLLF